MQLIWKTKKLYLVSVDLWGSNFKWENWKNKQARNHREWVKNASLTIKLWIYDTATDIHRFK